MKFQFCQDRITFTQFSVEAGDIWQILYVVAKKRLFQTVLDKENGWGERDGRFE